ncbi:hypothetical protein CXG81DRAFT_28181 [Caulochytrium protostelioides]|uniref:Nucleoside transporter n=1 Tax=Caulochytrium protostelioides TaxID=1555241 RepID=A0A4P9WZL8_9FUNG|nr:hypothetical protein CXG81DRAFT_28181 [Caulochytrium protostelioides]|eukprot:RKO99029.1 hypothetical protein CXG81DRAFT_28181 [Caulochytrium protostelioides]
MSSTPGKPSCAGSRRGTAGSFAATTPVARSPAQAEQAAAVDSAAPQRAWITPVVWSIFFIFGVESLTAFNTWITAASFFANRFRGSSFSDTFMPYFSGAYQACNAILVCFLVRYANKINPTYRIVAGFLMTLVVFCIAAAMALMNIAPTAYFFSTVALVALTGIASALLAGLYGLAATFPAKFTPAFTSGQGFAGALPSLATITLLLYTTTPTSDTASAAASAPAASASNSTVSVHAAAADAAPTSDMANLSNAVSWLEMVQLSEYFFVSVAVSLMALAGWFIMNRVIKAQPSLVCGQELVDTTSAEAGADADAEGAGAPVPAGLTQTPGKTPYNPDPANQPFLSAEAQEELEQARSGASTPSPEFGSGSSLVVFDEPDVEMTSAQVIRRIWEPLFCLGMNFWITLSIFPSLTSSVASQQDPRGVHGRFARELFVPVHFLLFNVGDWVGKMLPSMTLFNLTSSRKLTYLTLARLIFIPLLFACNVQFHQADGTLLPRKFPVFFGDATFYTLLTLMAMTSGHLGTNLIMHAPSLVTPSNRRLAGEVMVLGLTLGLVIGSLTSFGMRALQCGCNPFIS